MNPPMQFSDDGCHFLAELEGVKAKAYKDTANIWTIGIGHVIKCNEPELYKKTLTQAEIYALARKDLAWAVGAINDHVNIKLTQYQFDALVILVFNIGETNFLSSSILKALNKGNLSEADKHFDDWVKQRKNGKLVFSQGLQNRRDEEQELFEKGDYEKQR
jgi:lysozyme